MPKLLLTSSIYYVSMLGGNEGDTLAKKSGIGTWSKYLLSTEASTLWVVLQISAGSTNSKIFNDPIYWRILEIYFHAVMISYYCGSSVGRVFLKEAIILLVYCIYLMFLVANLLVDCSIIMYTLIILMISRMDMDNLPP